MMGNMANLADMALDFGIPADPDDTWRGFRKWGSATEDAKKREGLKEIFDEHNASGREYAGISLFSLEHERTRKKLIHLIHRLEVEGFSFGLEDEVSCDSASAEAASAFLRALPPEYRLPKIAPDGEGGVLLAWDNTQCELIMSVSEWALYPVVNPASKPEHLSVLKFDGEKIPEQLLGYLPSN